MLSKKFRPWHLIPFSIKYARLRFAKRPVLVHFEVTMRCNAQCGFCDYWKTDSSEKSRELRSFADAARHFQPMAQRPGKWWADLPALARDRLAAQGVQRIWGNDGSADWCTHSRPDLYFSHRRDKVSGRQAAAIFLG